MGDDTKEPFLSGCLTWGLTGLALVLIYLSFMGRADSQEEVSSAVVFNWVIVGPLCAFVVFLCNRIRCDSKIKIYTLSAIAWLFVSGLLSVWEISKMRMRMAKTEQAKTGYEEINNSNHLREQLRRSLRKAFGSQLQILDENIAQEDGKYGGRLYWILRLRPKDIGRYLITHRCSNSIGSYSIHENVYKFQIAPSQTTRTFTYTDRRVRTREEISPEACLGDSVILFFEISPRYYDHEFTLEHFSSDNELDDYKDEFVKNESIVIENPIDDCLSCVSVERGYIIPHIPPYIPYLRLSFKAKEPAEFNLGFSLDNTEPKLTDFSIPILIVDKEETLDVLISSCMSRNLDPDGGGSSAGSWKIGQDAAVLRVGDVLKTEVLPSSPTETLSSDDNIRVFVHELSFMRNSRYIHDHIKWKSYLPSQYKSRGLLFFESINSPESH